MRVLIGCEYSGLVRDAFAALGHDAWSCDLLPSERPGNHIVGDVLEVIKSRHWDFGGFHPPCTYVLNNGCRHLYQGGKRWNADGSENPRDPVRWAAMEAGARFFKACLECDIEHVYCENPVMVGYAQAVVGRNADQFIQPHDHGHGEQKKTGLWLRNLPLIVPSNPVTGREQRIHKMSPGPNRGHERSRTYPGFAAAFAAQWSKHLTPL